MPRRHRKETVAKKALRAGDTAARKVRKLLKRALKAGNVGFMKPSPKKKTLLRQRKRAMRKAKR